MSFHWTKVLELASKENNNTTQDDIETMQRNIVQGHDQMLQGGASMSLESCGQSMLNSASSSSGGPTAGAFGQ